MRDTQFMMLTLVMKIAIIYDLPPDIYIQHYF